MLDSVVACTLGPWWILVGGRSLASPCVRCGGPVQVTVHAPSSVPLPSGESLVQLRVLPTPGDRPANGHSRDEPDSNAAERTGAAPKTLARSSAGRLRSRWRRSVRPAGRQPPAW